jgi:hypothetical protein
MRDRSRAPAPPSSYSFCYTSDLRLPSSVALPCPPATRGQGCAPHPRHALNPNSVLVATHHRPAPPPRSIAAATLLSGIPAPKSDSLTRGNGGSHGYHSTRRLRGRLFKYLLPRYLLAKCAIKWHIDTIVNSYIASFGWQILPPHFGGNIS